MQQRCRLVACDAEVRYLDNKKATLLVEGGFFYCGVWKNSFTTAASFCRSFSVGVRPKIW